MKFSSSIAVHSGHIKSTISPLLISTKHRDEVEIEYAESLIEDRY